MKNLKSSILLSVIAMVLAFGCSSPYKVVNLSKNEEKEINSGFYYMLPKTLVNVEFEIRKKEYEKGVYAEYANSLLGLSNAITENGEKYSIGGVAIFSTSEPDPKSAFYVDPSNCKLSVNTTPLGIIESVNVKKMDDFKKTRNQHQLKLGIKNSDEEEQANVLLQPQKEMPKRKILIQTDSLMQELPLISTKKNAEKSMEAKAKELADYILNIQKKKLDLLSGEYGDQYNTGSVEFLYNKLDLIEKQYMAFFIGKVKTSISKKSVQIDPGTITFDNGKATISVAHFSEKDGLDALEKGEEAYSNDIFVELTNKNTLSLLSMNNDKMTKKQSTGGFVYKIPEVVNISLNYGSFSITKEMPISQLGKEMALPQKNMRLVFDTESGALLESKILKK